MRRAQAVEEGFDIRERKELVGQGRRGREAAKQGLESVGQLVEVDQNSMKQWVDDRAGAGRGKEQMKGWEREDGEKNEAAFHGNRWAVETRSNHTYQTIYVTYQLRDHVDKAACSRLITADARPRLEANLASLSQTLTLQLHLAISPAVWRASHV